jgi:peptidoglycan hydrolase-like protein with peptidoglycan-binding domain
MRFEKRIRERRNAATAGRACVAVAVLTLTSLGCKDAATRAREAEQHIRAQLKDPMAEALAQKLPPERVREAQLHLRALKEYLGEPNGVLDSVTVNAIQAFQDAHGLRANGMLTDETLEKLRESAPQKRS